MTRQQVYVLIDGERAHQGLKWGDRLQSVPGWLVILHRELAEAMEAWATTGDDRKALNEIRQVAAVAVCAMEQHGAPARKVVP